MYIVRSFACETLYYVIEQRSIKIENGEIDMFNSMLALAQTGDNSKPWLIAVCMIVSIVVVVALFIIGQKGKDEDEDEDDVEE